MKLLLTAFDPFGGDAKNPALESVKLIPEKLGSVDVVKLEVPTVFRKSIEAVVAAIQEHKPDIVLCIGQAGGRFEVTPERVALNIDDARIPDNEGNQPVDTAIYEDGEPAYFSNLPVKAMVEEIRACGIPSSLSNSAGTFVCNHLMYGLLYNIGKNFPGIRGGFIHVPFIPEQTVLRAVPSPSMSLADISRAIQAAIKAIEANSTDIHAPGGKEA